MNKRNMNRVQLGYYGQNQEAVLMKEQNKDQISYTIEVASEERRDVTNIITIKVPDQVMESFMDDAVRRYVKNVYQSNNSAGL